MGLLTYYPLFIYPIGKTESASPGVKKRGVSERRHPFKVWGTADRSQPVITSSEPERAAGRGQAVRADPAAREAPGRERGGRSYERRGAASASEPSSRGAVPHGAGPSSGASVEPSERAALSDPSEDPARAAGLQDQGLRKRKRKKRERLRSRPRQTSSSS